LFDQIIFFEKSFFHARLSNMLLNFVSWG